MKRGIVVVGRCVSRGSDSSTFRFNGVYKGERINRIIVNLGRNSDLVKGRDYILFLKLIRIDRANLVTSLIKYRDIS